MKAQGEEAILSQYLERIIPDVLGQEPAVVRIDEVLLIGDKFLSSD